MTLESDVSMIPGFLGVRKLWWLAPLLLSLGIVPGEGTATAPFLTFS